ncbi:hypothetical protein [Tritonibacter horizontis]|uniref:hypothetical protein n=1 Tax=Tritonibacter horizontis TaxID=1768241 RepID=UPI00083405AC|nr:hypothetical protein [Tritonibacter horizontis]
MTKDIESCLVSRLSRFVDLTERERDFIAEMEKDERPCRKGRTVVGDRSDEGRQGGQSTLSWSGIE